MAQFEPVTIRNIGQIAAPDFSDSNALRRAADKQITGGIGTVADAGQTALDTHVKQKSDEFIAHINSLPDDAARQQALQDADPAFLDQALITAGLKEARSEDRATENQLFLRNQKARAAGIAEISFDAAVRKEAHRKSANSLATSNLPQGEFNTQALALTQQDGGDPTGVLSREVNRRFDADANTQVIEDSVFTDSGIDSSKLSSYSKDAYERVIEAQYNKINLDHPHIPEKDKLAEARDAVSKTKHGKQFASQKWFEELNTVQKLAAGDSIAKFDARNTFRDQIKEITDALNSGDAADSESKVKQLAQFIDIQGDRLNAGPAQKQLQKFQKKVLSNYLTNEYKPVSTFLSSVITPDPETGISRTPVLNDYSPNNVEKYLNDQTQTLSERLGQDPATVKATLKQRLLASPAGPNIIRAEIPARIQVTRNEAAAGITVANIERNAKVKEGFIISGSAKQFTTDALISQFVGQNGKLTPKENAKVNRQVGKAYEKWQGFFTFGKDDKVAKENVKVAIHELMMESYIDIDKFDPNDIANANLSPTGDVSNANRQGVLLALLGKLDPSETPDAFRKVETLLDKAADNLAKKYKNKADQLTPQGPNRNPRSNQGR
jgi:hypothetical protein